MYGARLFLTVGSLFMAVILISSFVGTAREYDSAGLALLATAVCAVVALLASHALSRWLNRRRFVLVLLVLGLLVRVGWIMFNDAPPSSDFLFMFNAAKEAAAGRFDFANSAYYTSFPYQLGFTMYEAGIVRLFGGGVLLALKLLGALFNVGTAFILYYIGARLFNETSGRLAAVIYTFYLPNILMCSVLTNQHISVFLFFLGCSVLLRRRGALLPWLLAGLALGLGQLMRPIGLIYAVGIALFAVLEVSKKLRESRRRKAWRQAGMLLAMLGVFLGMQWAADAALHAGGVTKHDLSGGDKYWKFMVGLNPASDGAWNAEDAAYANQYPFGVARDRAELDKIKERLADKPELAALLGRKLVNMWGAADSAAYWSLAGTDRWRLERELSRVERPQYIAIAAFALLALLGLWRAGMYRGPLLYLLPLLMYAGAHLAIEIQTRYRLDLLPAVILLSGYGVWQTYALIQKRAAVGRQSRDATGGLGV